MQVTKLEQRLFDSLANRANLTGSLTMRTELYDAARETARQIAHRKILRPSEGHAQRKAKFAGARRYREILIATPPIKEEDPLPSIVDLVWRKKRVFESGINALGTVIVELKSKRFVVVVLGAFYAPEIPLKSFMQAVKGLPMKQAKLDASGAELFVKVLNEMRAAGGYHRSVALGDCPHFKSLVKLHVKADTVFEALAKGLSNGELFDMMRDVWTAIFVKVEPGERIELEFVRGRKKFGVEMVLKDEPEETAGEKPQVPVHRANRQVVISNPLEKQRLRDRDVGKGDDRAAQIGPDQKAQLEADLRAKADAERKAKLEADRKAKEQADRKAREEADRKAKEEADRKAKLEADRKAKEEAERKAKEEAEAKAN